MYIDEPEILDAAIAKLPQEFYDRFTIVKSTPFYLEILKKTANKGIAVTHLAEKLGLSKEETMLSVMKKMTVLCLKSLALLLLWKMVIQN